MKVGVVFWTVERTCVAIQDAIETYGISVLNMSGGASNGDFEELRASVLDAHKAGIMLVAASGNAYAGQCDTTCKVPAALDDDPASFFPA